MEEHILVYRKNIFFCAVKAIVLIPLLFIPMTYIKLIVFNSKVS